MSHRNDFGIGEEVRMRQGEFALVSGAQGQEQLMEVLTNNLANVDTPGFKKDRVTFQTYMPHKELLVKKPETQPGTNLTPWGEFPDPWGMAGQDVPHSGVDRIHVRYSQGMIRQTGNPLDMAINGDGFFHVSTPKGAFLTRNGRFTMDATGGLVTHEGYPVLDQKGEPVKIPVGGKDMTIRVRADGSLFKGNQFVAKLGIYMPRDGVQSLSKIGEGLFQSGKIDPVAKPRVMDGGYETSNVNGTAEMVRMIQAMRAFQTHVQVMKAMNELTNRTVNDISIIA